MSNRLVKFFTSLRLTVVLLAFAIILVWVGTVAQADEGLYNAQTRYFKQWVVVGITLFGHRIPAVLPGGYLIGTMLLANLIAAHVYRFQLTTKKLGIQLAHAGVILLLVGQLTTDIFSREMQIRLSEGETKAYAEDPSNYELVFVTSADDKSDEEIAISQRRLAQTGEIGNSQWPFKVVVKRFWKKSVPSFRAPMMKNAPPLTTNGIAASFDFLTPGPKFDLNNVPSALIEIVGPNGSLGDWVVSSWAGDPGLLQQMTAEFATRFGDEMAGTMAARMALPQSFMVNAKVFQFTLRPERVYQPYSLTLLKATHSVYAGSDIPKDFRSRVRLTNSRTGENREVEIFMNSPLRYNGLTFYQYQMDASEVARAAGGKPWSVLQVVRNPGWLTPYVGCGMVAGGLVIQFLFHLVGFISKRRPATGGSVQSSNRAGNGRSNRRDRIPVSK
jgi:hypothetical protein